MNVTDGNDALSDLSLSDMEGITGEITNITGSDFEVNVMYKSGNLWK